MAKNKKHRKSNKGRRARAQSSNLVATSADTDVILKSSDTNASIETKTSLAAKPVDTTYDDVDLGYVKEDVRKTLILIALILAVYALLWVLITYTSLGSQSLKLISR